MGIMIGVKKRECMFKKMKKENLIITSALKMFSKYGFYNTRVSEVAKNIDMSVGNIYNYFPSKNSLAKASIVFVSKKLASKLRNINDQDISSKEKITLFVKSYLLFLNNHPEMINYFFKVYLGNREVFCDNEDCGFELAQEFVDELKRLIEDGTQRGEFIKQDFFICFACIAGILGGITFLNSEQVLNDSLEDYSESLSNAIYKSIS